MVYTVNGWTEGFYEENTAEDRQHQLLVDDDGTYCDDTADGNGFSSTGFYVGFLLLIILVVGMYVAYTGLIKRETSKALHAVINFVVVFVLSASFIAYAPDYIKKINEFSSDISTASLDLGTKIMLPNSDSEGKDSVNLIRDSLFSIQVEQPWLLLQFGNSNAEEIGTDRVEALV